MGLQNLGMSVQGFSFSEQVFVKATLRLVVGALAVDITTGLKQLVLELLQFIITDFGVVDKFGVASLSALKLLNSLVTLGSKAVVIPAQGVILIDVLLVALASNG